MMHTPQSSAPRPAGPFSVFERMLALRYLRARRREGFISVIAGFSFAGVMLGVATLIIVLSVMNGFRNELLGKIVGINGHLFIQPIERPLTDHIEVSARLSATPGVTAAFGMIEGQALASSPVGNSGVLVRGVRGEDLPKAPGIAGNLVQGTIDGFDAAKGVAIGARLATVLGVRVGERLTIVSPQGAATPFGVAPRLKSYPVVAVFEIGMSEFDSTFVYMPFDEADAYFSKEGEASVIVAWVAEPDRIDAARARVDAAAGRPILLVDWRQRNRTFFSALEVERNVMFLILTLIVLVAALNIVSGMIMLVKDKASAIAILRTMGATRGAILRVFLMTGAAIGVFGTLAGFLLGLVVTLNVESIRAGLSRLSGTALFPPELYFLSRLPAQINPAEVGVVVGVALTLSVAATIYPAWKAARLDPVEALRQG